MALGKKRVTKRSDLDPEWTDSEHDSSQENSKGDETRYNVFAPSSTPITGRVIDFLSLKRSCRTFTTDVTNRISTWTKTNNVTWICRLSSWSSRPHWRTRFLCLGDGENSCMARDALEHAGLISWQNELKSRVSTDVMQRHNSLQC